MATPAPACKAALHQATVRWPKRSKASDGIMGDASHQARKSDHNQGDAFDLTHDPQHGCDCEAIRLAIVKDPRTRYVIFNRKIWSRVLPFWRRYTGSNPHAQHMHVSIVVSKRGDASPWKGIAASAPVATLSAWQAWSRYKGNIPEVGPKPRTYQKWLTVDAKGTSPWQRFARYNKL